MGCLIALAFLAINAMITLFALCVRFFLLLLCLLLPRRIQRAGPIPGTAPPEAATWGCGCLVLLFVLGLPFALISSLGGPSNTTPAPVVIITPTAVPDGTTLDGTAVWAQGPYGPVECDLPSTRNVPACLKAEKIARDQEEGR